MKKSIINLLLVFFLFFDLGCVQKIHVNEDERCALRYNGIQTRDVGKKYMLAKENEGHAWKNFLCQKPSNAHQRCLLYRYKHSGMEKEKFNRWYDKYQYPRFALDGLLIPWPFVEGYYKYRKNKAEDKARVAMFSQCLKTK